MEPIQILFVDISPRVNDKINNAHDQQCSSVDVEDALGTMYGERWGQNKNGVWRVLAKGKTSSGRTIFLVLYPTDKVGVWNLGTAFPIAGD